MGCGASQPYATPIDAPDVNDSENEAKVEQILKLKGEQPNNIAFQAFDVDYYRSLPKPLQSRLLRCLTSAIENPDSGLSCYASTPQDYEQLQPFFSKALSAYHKLDAGAKKHKSNWDTKAVQGAPSRGTLDLASLGLPPTSVRVRASRNLKKYPLPSAMTKEQRCALEADLCLAFNELNKIPQFRGDNVSLTPEHPKFVNKWRCMQLVESGLLFKDISEDPCLKSAGVSSDWPFGRGCFMSSDKQLCVWVGERDHVRVTYSQRGTNLSAAFDCVKKVLDVLEKKTGGYAVNSSFGFVSSCAADLGTGMRASAHIVLPKLCADGTGKANAIAQPLDLTVRSKRGDVAAGDVLEVSTTPRLFVSEAETMCLLYTGLSQLKAAEDASQ